jgi:transcriptional regulator of acetoin/glycerol metabolism
MKFATQQRRELRTAIAGALRTYGTIRGAARALGIPRATLHDRARAMGIKVRTVAQAARAR